MMTKDNGGPAFPHHIVEHFGGERFEMPTNGMTLRDWFAGESDANGYNFPDVKTAADWIGIPAPDEDDFVSMLEFSFKLEAFIRFRKADAMLAARDA